MVSDELRAELYLYVLAIAGLKPSQVSDIRKNLDSVELELKNGSILYLYVKQEPDRDNSLDYEEY